MALSSMSSREKIVVGVLGVVILLALVGIGILAANLVSGDDEEQVAGESATAAAGEGEGAEQPAGAPEGTATAGAAAEVGATEVAASITPVATPALEGEAPLAAPTAGGQVLVRQEGLAGPAPVVIVDQALQPGRRYRIEIQAMDGSRVEIHGSWSQAAVGGGGTLSAPTIEFFEGQTPYRIELALPMADVQRWSCSVSAAPKLTALGPAPALAIEIVDETGSQ